MQRILIVNPRSGTASPSAEELAAAAHERGIEPRLLEARAHLSEERLGRIIHGNPTVIPQQVYDRQIWRHTAIR